MAMKRTILISFAVAAMLIQLGSAENYTVGGNSGWDTSSDIQTWASTRKFLVGDNLVFQYSPMHNVVEVTKSDYDNCQATNLIQAYSDGNTVIALTASGKRYFICGTPGHCSGGMKLEVDTLATASSPAASPPRRSVSPSPASPSAAGSPDAAAPTMSTHSPSPSSSSDDIPSASPFAPSTETHGTAPAPSAAPARGGFRAGLVLGLFGAIVIVLAF